MNKKAIEMGFNWLFAIIAGSFILFLAIYSASKFIGTQEEVLYTETAARIQVLFDPLETGLASGKSSEIGFKKESRLYFSCDERSNQPFGKQKIGFSEKTFGEKFGEKGGDVSIKDKYIFTEDILEGRKVYLFTKPFFMGFKVADITVISANNYCFYDTPEEIREDVEGLNLKNVFFPNQTFKCEGIDVCFKSSCDISVKASENYVEKAGTKLYYEGDLIYGAIFSSSDIYECNIKRLMAKFTELGSIYLDKVEIIERKGCYPTLQGKLLNAMEFANRLKTSKDIIRLYELAEEIDVINEQGKSGCRLY